MADDLTQTSVVVPPARPMAPGLPPEPAEAMIEGPEGLPTLRRSATIGKLVEALAQAQAVMLPAVKGALNPFFKGKYADLAAVWEACRKPLGDHGLAVIQGASAQGRRVTITTLLAHTSDEWIEERLTMTSTQDTPQGIGSTITYARRYALSAMVGVAPEDDDANAGSSNLPAGIPHDKGGRSSLQQPIAQDKVIPESPAASVEAAPPARVSRPTAGAGPPPPAGKPPARAPGG